MTTRNVLRMSFRTEHGRTVSINLLDPVAELDASDVSDCMDKVVLGDIFDTSSGAIQAKLKAETVSTTTTSVVDYD